MDDETRYWLAFDLADTKHAHRAEKLFKMTKDQAGKIPDEFVTDGINSYKTAARSEFGDLTNHISEIHITGRKVGKDNNNKMKRLNGTIRDREKDVQRIRYKVHCQLSRHEGTLQSCPKERCSRFNSGRGCRNTDRGCKQMEDYDPKW